jgi:hypothetical protein
MKTSIKSIHATKRNLFIKTLFACLIVAAFSFAAIPTSAGDAEDKAKQAFAAWKAANKAVADAKANLEKAREKQQIEMDKARDRKKKKKKDDAQDKQLEDARAEVAAAEAALEKAEAALVAARVALEKAIAELPDGELKDQLKRERNFPSLVTANGLHTVKFDTISGQVIVHLPDDMAAGDTISGTVVMEPKGITQEERAKNQHTLEGYVLEIGNQKVPASKSPFNWEIPFPPQQMKSSYTLVIIEASSGKEVANTTIPVLSTPPNVPRPQTITPNDFRLPTIGQQGRPVEISGPFDGNSSNTALNRSVIQDFEKNTENVSGGFGLIAESPRKAVFSSPDNVAGPIQITLKEGNTQTTGTYRNVGVNLTAPKTNLLKGEKTELRVEVSGLQGIKQPVPLTLESKGVITMEGGMFQPLFIQPSEVGADGRYTTTRGITGVQTGGWSSTATVVTQPFNIVLRDPTPPQTMLINSFTGDYVFCGAGPKLTGTGQIKRQGCVITLTDTRPDRSVNGTFDSCVPVDNGRFSTFYSAGTNTDIQVVVTDTQPPKKKIYFNPLDRPMPPVQDVSAFATCP